MNDDRSARNFRRSAQLRYRRTIQAGQCRVRA